MQANYENTESVKPAEEPKETTVLSVTATDTPQSCGIVEDILRLRNCKSAIKSAINEIGGKLTDERISNYYKAFYGLSLSQIYVQEASYKTSEPIDNSISDTWTETFSTGLKSISQLHVFATCVCYTGFSPMPTLPIFIYTKYTSTSQEVIDRNQRTNVSLDAKLKNMENGECSIEFSFGLNAYDATARSQTINILIIAI